MDHILVPSDSVAAGACHLIHIGRVYPYPVGTRPNFVGLSAFLRPTSPLREECPGYAELRKSLVETPFAAD